MCCPGNAFSRGADASAIQLPFYLLILKRLIRVEQESRRFLRANGKDFRGKWMSAVMRWSRRSVDFSEARLAWNRS
jgi:hypothetical protein